MHMPGLLNVVADALSRRPDYCLLYIHSSIAVEDPLDRAALSAGYHLDRRFSPILADLGQPSPGLRVSGTTTSHRTVFSTCGTAMASRKDLSAHFSFLSTTTH